MKFDDKVAQELIAKTALDIFALVLDAVLVMNGEIGKTENNCYLHKECERIRKRIERRMCGHPGVH